MAGALSRLQTGEGGDGGIQAGQYVGDGNADLRWRTLNRASDAHQSAERLHGIVVAREFAHRAGSSVAGDRADDEARIDRMQTRGIEAELDGAVGAEVLEQDVAFRGELVKESDAFGMRQI